VLWSCAQGRNCRWHGFSSKVSLSASRLTNNLLQITGDYVYFTFEKKKSWCKGPCSWQSPSTFSWTGLLVHMTICVVDIDMPWACLGAHFSPENIFVG
jgi:hypothetical protein